MANYSGSGHSFVHSFVHSAVRSAKPVAVCGSATIELLVVVPFVLVLLAAVWDLREYIGYRTELARELYVVAEAIADDPSGSPPFELAIRQAEARLRENSSAGAISAAVVVRGTLRPDASACPDEGWCLPRVTVAWPPDVDGPAGTWSGDDESVCTQVETHPLPAEGSHFASEQWVLPNEGGDHDDPLPESDWISRNLSDTEWWVVVDTCVDPEPGLFIGRLSNMAARMLDTSFALRKRAVWGSIHDLADCDWCE